MNSDLLGKESSLRKLWKKSWLLQIKVNGKDSRLERQKRLDELKIRLEKWLSVLHDRDEGGPSLMEMDLIVKEIENKLESIKKQDQG